MRQMSDIIFNQHPLIMPASATVRAACEGMRDKRAGSVLVTDRAGALVGIFTGRDAVSRIIAEGRDADKTTLERVMTKEPMIVSPDVNAVEALRMMWDFGFRHLPVCDKGKILGVVSRGDFRGAEQDRLDEEINLWQRLR
ncbi:MAG TPA: CBS domain-containing protein [Alphaproteobacteria bacterium]|nr:CBS domain-containing protein [Alphaproteobacteria bacterium]